MPLFICTACGTQYPESDAPPAQCRICEEERQYVPPGGQTWTTLAALPQSHVMALREYEPGIFGIGTQPAFAIGQRALLRADAGRQCAVGLHRQARCRDGDADQGTRRPQGDRDLASAFLHDDGRVGAGVRLPGPSPRRRPATGSSRPDAAIIVERRDARLLGRRDAGALRRPFSRRHGAALAGGADGTRHRLRRRHPLRRRGPQVAFLHAQLSEFHSAVARAKWRRIGAALAPFAFDTIYGHYFDRVIERRAKRCWRSRSRAMSPRSTGRGDISFRGGAACFPRLAKRAEGMTRTAGTCRPFQFQCAERDPYSSSSSFLAAELLSLANTALDVEVVAGFFSARRGSNSGFLAGGLGGRQQGRAAIGWRPAFPWWRAAPRNRARSASTGRASPGPSASGSRRSSGCGRGSQAMVVLVVPTSRMICASFSSGWLRTSHRIAFGRSWRRDTGV